MTKQTNPLVRKPGESEYNHHKRLVYGKLIDKTLSDYDYTELAQYVYGKDYSGDVARRMFYGSCKTLQAQEADTEINSIESLPLQKLYEKNLELKKNIQTERIKLQTEKAEYNRWRREDVRDEMFEEKVIEAIRGHISPIPPPAKIVIENGRKEGLLCIADCHFGKEYKLYGLHDEIINEYSPEIFYERMERVLQETIAYAKKEGLQSIRVYNLGDSVEGFIRNSQIWSLRWGVIDSAIIYGNFMGDWLRRLTESVRVTYCQTDGNHDELRLLDGKKGQHLCDSAGTVIKNCIMLKNENNPNFNYTVNKTGLIYDDICGYKVLGVHGELKDPASAIQEYNNIYNTNISYLIGGHKHYEESKRCGLRKGCIRVGSVIGSDEFSMQIRQCSDATASLFIFEEGKGKVDEHTIVLN